MKTHHLKELLQDRLCVFDGAMGTQIQVRNLSADDFGGETLEGCNENLNLTRPKIIEEIHRSYLEAGADFIETNTFGATSLVLQEYGLETKTLEINREAARVARRAADTFGKYVAGSMGPTTKSICITGGVTFEALADFYAEQAQGLIEGGVDLLLLETGQDTLNIKAGLLGISKTLLKLGISKDDIPIIVSGTIEPMGTMLAGQSIEALVTSLEHAALMGIGINCATGPDAMRDHIQALSKISNTFVLCMPNAGLPDEEGNYHESPQGLAEKLSIFCEKQWLNILGGCCGTTPEHVRAIAQMAKNFNPRQPIVQTRAAVSGMENLDLLENRPLIVGERTNVIGSKLFKDLITQEKFEEGAEVGRRQVRHGAHVIDVCLANTDREEESDMLHFLHKATKLIKAPFMIDSTDPKVIEESLKCIQGKSIVNSVNLEDGEDRFQKICPLLKKYGAAVVVGCIDEDLQQGMGITAERKLEIARRSFELLTQKYQVSAKDIIFDPLVFPCGTGDKQYIGSAQETIKGIRSIKQAFPECMTVLGISNVSFGLPSAGRQVLNTVFLHANLEAGLDMAIVNSEKLQRVTQIPEAEVELCQRLIESNLDNFDTILAEFTAHFRHRPQGPKIDKTNMPVEQRLAQAVVEGIKTDLIEDLEEIRQDLDPLSIINGPLMTGMKEVGELFRKNQLIVAEVLQSAEVMKAAVSHLEQFMTKSNEASRGKMLLATVKGDVHDIGKNLVEIIFSNNGFKIINLGIKVLPRTLIDAFHKHQPDLIGLSGLLVKSAQEMVVTADALRNADISVPLFVGGAALSEKFSYSKISAQYNGTVCYARDAMTGLALANRITDPNQADILKKELRVKQESIQARINATRPSSTTTSSEPAQKNISKIPPRAPPNLNLNILDDLPLETIWTFINPVMLYTRHLGLKDRGDNPKAKAFYQAVQEVQDWVLDKKILSCKGLYQFFKVNPKGDSIIIKGQSKFDFPRQPNKDRLCLSDFLADEDYLGMMVTSCQGARVIADNLKDQGEYLQSHILSALAIETAEAAAEWLHQKMRAMWGISDPAEISMKALFSARYQGKRYSFGYPACPDLENQTILWNLLQPNRHIGVDLTSGFMMDPESSVSALVFHHPDAVYFSVA